MVEEIKPEGTDILPVVDPLDLLHPMVRRLLNPHRYKVSLGPTLSEETEKLSSRNRVWLAGNQGSTKARYCRTGCQRALCKVFSPRRSFYGYPLQAFRLNLPCSRLLVLQYIPYSMFLCHQPRLRYETEAPARNRKRMPGFHNRETRPAVPRHRELQTYRRATEKPGNFPGSR